MHYNILLVYYHCLICMHDILHYAAYTLLVFNPLICMHYNILLVFYYCLICMING